MSAMYSLNLDSRKCNLYRPSVDLDVQGIHGGEDRGSVPGDVQRGSTSGMWERYQRPGGTG